MRFTLALAIVCLSFGLSIASESQAAVRKPTEIPAQQLSSALQALAKDRGLQVLYVTDEINKHQTNGASGDLTPDEALTQLLFGTGLTYRYLGENSVSIFPVSGRDHSATTGLTSEFVNDGAVRIASVHENAQTPSVTEGSRDEAATADQPTSQEIVVTGTHIRGLQDLPSPSTVIDREEIQRQGLSSIEAVVQRLPKNLNEVNLESNRGSGASSVAAANFQGATGISLRGLGPGSTLVLLNGKRRPGNINGRVVDLSSIPLSVVEGIEIVTGGRSAIYGSDAVAGVVNITTRKHFSGGETQLSYGGAQAGGERSQASQAFGFQSSRASGMVAYDFTREEALDITDTGVLRPSGPGGSTLLLSRLIPDSRRHSAYAAGSMSLTDNLELYGDVLYSRKRLRNPSSQFYPDLDYRFDQSIDLTGEQYSGVAGLQLKLGRWQIDTSAGAGTVSNKEHFDVTEIVGGAPFAYAFTYYTDAKNSFINSILEGPVLRLGEREIRVAAGVEHRAEEYAQDNIEAFLGPDLGAKRSINSIFAELNAPLDVVDLSVAGRYDRYSDFGGTFNPQAGVVWHIGHSLKARAAYSRAFRAPDLYSIASTNVVNLRRFQDPTAPGGQSVVLQWTGGNAQLDPERARNLTIGFDYSDSGARAWKAGLYYFNILYRDRITVPVTGPDVTAVLTNESRYPTLIDRHPTAAQLAAILATDADGFIGGANAMNPPFDPSTQQLLDVFPNIVLFDDREANVSTERATGLDFNTQLTLAVAGGELTPAFNVTYNLKHNHNVTSQSPTVDLLERPGKPAKYRVRATTAWQRGAFSLFAGINYTDSYADTFSIPARRMASWTTTDVSVGFDGSRWAPSGLFGGLWLSLSATNIFDVAPPAFLSSAQGLGYDPINASAVGRFVSMTLRKQW